MAGYLATYGAGEEQRERLTKRLLLGAVILLAVVGVLYFYLKNYRQDQQVKKFFELLQKHDYTAAYALWGCTQAKPCPEYPFKNFMEDWGPQSSRGNIVSYRIRRSRSCGSGVIMTIDFGNNQQERLWVERDSLVIGFSPWPGCPAFK